MSEMYVDSGYVESGYVEGDAVDLSTATKKKINFVVDNANLSDDKIQELLSEKYGENYADDVSVIFSEKIKIAQKSNEVFEISEIAASMNRDEVSSVISEEFYSKYDGLIEEKINNLIEDRYNSFVENEIGGIVESKVKDYVEKEDTLLYFAEEVAKKISVNFNLSNGDVLDTSLVYNSETNSYEIKYDSEQLSGIDYTISIKIS